MVTLDAALLGVGHPALQNGGRAELIRQDEKNAWVQPVFDWPLFGWPIFVVPLAAIVADVPMMEFIAMPMATVDTLSQPGEV